MVDSNANIPISSEEYKKVTEELYKQNLEVVRLYKQVENLNHELQIANEGQTNLIHIINHQIKSYMTKARYIYDALLNDSDYGPISEKARPMIEKGHTEVTEGVNFVQDFLVASNIEKGTFTYDIQPLDFKNMVIKVGEKQKEIAREKGLSL